MLGILLRFIVAFSYSTVVIGGETPKLMTAADLGELAHPPPDVRLAYGEEPFQFGELRVPRSTGPHPVVLFIHGGCWRAKFGLDYADELMASLTENGFATWSIEYRRVGNEGGGWPNTFKDVAHGADHLAKIASDYNLDLDRVIAMGHSAGGHFALWLAARANLPATAPVAANSPLHLKGIVALAPAPDLMHLHDKQVCGHIIDKLMGGSPAEFPQRYQWADPVQLPVQGTKQILIIGKFDKAWAPVGLRYFGVAKKRGDDVKVLEAAESGHFEMVDPDSSTWPLVLGATRALFME